MPRGEARPHGSARPGAHLQPGPYRGPAAARCEPPRPGEAAVPGASPRTSALGLGARQPPPEGGSAPSGPVPAVRPPPCRPSGRASRRHFVCVGLRRALCVCEGSASQRRRPRRSPEMARQGLSRALVTAAWLAEAVRAGRVGAGLRVLDASWYPPKERNARQEFKERHIPGASFFDIEECRDKSSPYDFMLPSESHFADYVGGLGVSNDTHVVVYDGDEVGTFYAPRAWWMFRAFGHKEVSVLNGGFKNWVKEGHPVTAEVTQPTPAVFKARLNKALVKTFEEMVQNVSSLKFQVVDSRPEGRFRGTELDQGNGSGTGTCPRIG